MIYKFTIPGQEFVVCETISDKACFLFAYRDLGVTTLRDWKNLFKAYLTAERLELKQMDGRWWHINAKNEGTPVDVLNLLAQGYTIQEKTDTKMTLERTRGGRVFKLVNEQNVQITADELLKVIETGYTIQEHSNPVIPISPYKEGE
jgi:hypothetical protein